MWRRWPLQHPSVCGSSCRCRLACVTGQTFQRLMSGILQGLPYVFVYLDDILIASPDPESHLSHLHEVFSCLESRLIVRREKCSFGLSSITFLGHVVSSNGIHPLPSKIQAVTDFPLPKTSHDLSHFLGLVNHYVVPLFHSPGCLPSAATPHDGQQQAPTCPPCLALFRPPDFPAG